MIRRDPCLDPETRKPLDKSGFTWIDGRTEGIPKGECHRAYVRLPTKAREDGLRIGLVTAHGDRDGYGLSGFVPEELQGIILIEPLRPGYCGKKNPRCSSGKQSEYYNAGGPLANRTPEVANSFKGLITNAKEIYRLDLMLVMGMSGGNNIMSNAAVSTAEGGFFLGTSCDDDKWRLVARSLGDQNRQVYRDNIDQMDAIPQFADHFVSVIMNGAQDDNTVPELGRLCYETTIARGLEARFESPAWLGHSYGLELRRFKEQGRIEDYEAGKKEIREAWEWLIERTIAKYKERQSARRTLDK
ncbi:MAG: hypothetical protein HQL45_13680 [Alphaproteobacteria bacterium]|nr:hypothetical protein [Alphaproteobacteria bacterium]